MAGPIAEAFVEIRPDSSKFGPEAERDLARVFGGVEGVAERAGERIDNSFREAARQSETALRGIGGSDAFAPVVATAEVAAERVDNSFRDAAHESNRSLSGIGTGLAALGAAGAAAGATIVGFGLKQAGSLEQTQIGFESLLGSAGKADAFIKEMQQFAAATPFEFPGLADASRRLLAVGNAAGIAQQEIIPTIGVVGNLVSVLGAPQESLDRVVSTIGQIASKGKLSTEEMLQLGEALPGFSPLQALADGLGVSTAQAQDMVTKGLVPAQQGIDLLLKGMEKFPGAAGAMEKQSKTLIGLFSTFKDTITLTLTEAFGPLVDTVKEGLGPLTESVGTALEAVAPALSSLVGGLIPLVGPLLETVATVIGPILGGLGDALGALAENFGDTLGEIMPELGAIAKAIGGVLAALGPVFAEVLGTVVTVISALLPAILPIINTVASVIGALGPVIGEVTTAIAPLLRMLGGTLGAVIERLASALLPVFVTILSGVTSALGPLFEALMPVVDALGGALMSILDALAPVLPPLADVFALIAIAVGELLTAIVPLLVPLVQLAALLIEKIGAPVLLLLAEALAKIAVAVAWLADKIATNLAPWIQALADRMSRDLQPGLEAVGRFFLRLADGAMVVYHAVADFLDPLIVAMAAFWRDTLGPIVGGLTDALLWLVDRAIAPFVAIIEASVNPLLWLLDKALDGVRWQFSLVVDVLGFLLDAAGPVLRFLRDEFIASLERVTFVVDLVKSAIGFLKDRFDDAVEIGKSVIGFFKDLWHWVDRLLDPIDRLVNGVGSLVGGALGKIPGLALGGIIEQPTLAVIGERAREVVIPLNDPARAAELALASGLMPLIAQGMGATASAASINPGTFTGTQATSLGNGGTSIVFGPNAIVVEFHNAVPTAAEARSVGENVGAGIASTLAGRQIKVAGRTS